MMKISESAHIEKVCSEKYWILKPKVYAKFIYLFNCLNVYIWYYMVIDIYKIDMRHIQERN